MNGDGDVVSGWKNKLQAAIANVTPAGDAGRAAPQDGRAGNGGAKVDGAGASRQGDGAAHFFWSESNSASSGSPVSGWPVEAWNLRIAARVVGSDGAVDGSVVEAEIAQHALDGLALFRSLRSARRPRPCTCSSPAPASPAAAGSLALASLDVDGDRDGSAGVLAPALPEGQAAWRADRHGTRGGRRCRSLRDRRLRCRRLRSRGQLQSMRRGGAARPGPMPPPRRTR